jgi:hypothetical protein
MGGNHHHRRSRNAQNSSSPPIGGNSGGNNKSNRKSLSTFTSTTNSNNNSNHHRNVNADQYHQFKLLMMEGTPGSTKNQILCLVFTILSFMTLIIVIGIALGMTVSVHYFEQQNPVAAVAGAGGKFLTPQLLYSNYHGGLSSSSPSVRVTMLDADIAASNVIHKDGIHSWFDLGKVITTTDSGQLSVLMVVQEEMPVHATPLWSTSPTQRFDITTNGLGYDPGLSIAEYNTSHDDSSATAIPMTLEQAEKVLPGYTEYLSRQPKLKARQPIYRPSLCPDGNSYGFQDWYTLRAAVQEANYLAAERFMKWNEYFATHLVTSFEDESLYYEHDVIFRICPQSVLKSTSQRHSIIINSENIVLECDGCIIDVRGTHFAFGSNAKNVLVRGITFESATSSSLTFFHDGAEATFEDCTWINNVGAQSHLGSVADVNSTSIVNFYRCEIGFRKKSQQRSWWGRWRWRGPMVATKSTSSLSIRSN